MREAGRQAALKIRETRDKIVLDTAKSREYVEPLPKRYEKEIQHERRLPESSLGSAIDELGRHARTTGEEPFELRQEAAVKQRETLVRWAKANGLIVDPSLWEGKTIIGGSEHDIWEQDGEIWKVTREDRFGWTVLPGSNGRPTMSEATPLEYLERWDAANEVLGDLARLRGVAPTEHGVRVVVSQPFIKGGYPQTKDVQKEMSKRGYTLVPGLSIGSEAETSYINAMEGIAIFDASTDNFIMSRRIPIPIDVIVLRIGKLLGAQLERLIGK